MFAVQRTDIILSYVNNWNSQFGSPIYSKFQPTKIHMYRTSISRQPDYKSKPRDTPSHRSKTNRPLVHSKKQKSSPTRHHTDGGNFSVSQRQSIIFLLRTVKMRVRWSVLEDSRDGHILVAPVEACVALGMPNMELLDIEE